MQQRRVVRFLMGEAFLWGQMYKIQYRSVSYNQTFLVTGCVLIVSNYFSLAFN